MIQSPARTTGVYGPMGAGALAVFFTAAFFAGAFFAGAFFAGAFFCAAIHTP